jgi:hypothetical protein
MIGSRLVAAADGAGELVKNLAPTRFVGQFVNDVSSASLTIHAGCYADMPRRGVRQVTKMPTPSNRPKQTSPYHTVRGQHRAFDLIELRPTRGKGQVPVAVRRDIERELTNEYLREQIAKALHRELDDGLSAKIRTLCEDGLKAIVFQKIDEIRRGSGHDTRLKSLQTNLRALAKSLQTLEKGEIDAVTAAIDRLCNDEDEARRRFLIFRAATEYLYTGERLKDPLPPTIGTNPAFRKEATEQNQHPAEFWLEIMLQLAAVGEEWVAAATQTPTLRGHPGRPTNAALNALSEQLYGVYERIDSADQGSHGRFRKFLNIVLGPLIPENYLPAGGFKSIATTTRQKIKNSTVSSEYL